MITRKQIIKAAKDFANREYEISDIDIQRILLRCKMAHQQRMAR